MWGRRGETHLVVDLQRVVIALGTEVLRVFVHGDVDMPVEALNEHRVPMLVVQQAAQRHWHVPAAGVMFGVVLRIRRSGRGCGGDS